MSELNVLLIRHAEREETGEHISAQGKKKARQLGRELRDRYLKGAIVPLCSQLIRARETLDAFLVGAEIDGVTVTEEAALQNKTSSKFSQHWNDLEVPNHRDAGVDHYLKFRNRKPDAVTISPREVAERISLLIWKYIEQVKSLLVPSPACVIMVTHSGIVELFLAHVLLRRERGGMIRGFRQAKEIGGILDNLEVAHLHFEVIDGGSIIGSLFLRDKEYGVDIEEVRQLASH